MIIELFIAFCVGVLVQRVYAARVKGFFELGKSWTWAKGKWFKKLHRFYCEFCPRRLYCERYKKEIKK